MHELREIVAHAARCRERGERTVLATLVAVRGSHYRKPGARMLLAGAESTGVLSGGCLEGDLAERAARVLTRGTPEVVEYDLTRAGDALWGFGLGCAGVVTVLLEPLPAAAPHGPLAFAERCLARRERGALATLFAVTQETAGAAPGAWLALDAAGTISGDLAPALAERVLSDLRAVLDGAATRGVELAWGDGSARALLEPVEPPVSLVLCGAGRDAVPMATAARALGWEVTLVDLQGLAATAERFAGVERVLGGPVRGLADRLLLAPRAAAVVMTHRYLDDLALLEELLPLPFGYLGLLGPRARRERLLDDLAARGVVPSPTVRARLFGPAGLDLGSETPAEIALAVLAEALAVLGGRPAPSVLALAALADAAAAEAPASAVP